MGDRSPSPLRRRLLGLAALLPASALAKHVYSWKDERGVLQFSDQKPRTAQAVKATRVEVAARTWVSSRDSRAGDLAVHWLRNHYGGPIEVEVSLVEGENLVTDPPLPLRLELPAGIERQVFHAAALAPGRYRYRWSWRYVPGSPRAQPDPAALYRLPFASTVPLRVDQGFGGAFSHHDEFSYHAIDIGMPEGTPIVAARGGTVMEIEDDFYGAGTDQKRYGDRANYVRVLHADGTMAVYAHLELESVLVAVGQQVNAGQRLGRSGNTGYSTGPHLHFVVQRNAGMRIVSVPFRFELPDGAAEPRQDMVLAPP